MLDSDREDTDAGLEEKNDWQNHAGKWLHDSGTWSALLILGAISILISLVRWYQG